LSTSPERRRTAEAPDVTWAQSDLGKAPLAGLAGVVTGASGDIGGAIALSLAELGATVCVVARRVPELEALAARVGVGSPPMVVRQADLTVDREIARLADTAEQELGRVDFLVHSAGTIAFGTHEAAPTDDFDLQYRANVRAPYTLTKALLPLLKASQGQIVFVSSTAALQVRAGLGQFAATQHALKAVADTLRAEINAAGVRVLTVYLGRTATARQARIFELEGRSYTPELLMQPSDVAEMVLAALRLPRTAEVTEISMRPLVKSY
jgi:NADP-dependent 3-hydroxy acid dehydrogenase YdfG